MAGRKKVDPVIPSRSLIASAHRYEGGKVERIWRPTLAWQKDAWDQYDLCPELRAASNWIANALSRCIITAGEVDQLGRIIGSEDAKTQDALNKLFGGSDGQASLLASFGLHLTVAGECYLVGRIPTDSTGKALTKSMVWEVVGILEMEVNGNSWSIKDGEGAGSRSVPLKDTDTVIRIWKPHPKRRMEADSPIKALLPTLTEIELYSRHIFAQLTSRLAGSGIMFLPASVEFPGVQEEDKAAAFMKLLSDHMMAPLNDPGNAASLVPIIAIVSDESIDKIKEAIHFWSPFDEKVIESRKVAVLRFCTGMDMPPELIQGMTSGASKSGGTGTGASHWTAYQISEEAIKLHLEPLLEVITSSLAIGYIRPVTNNPLAAGVYDTNALKLQPDRSKEAMELFDRGLINVESLFMYLGFKDSDRAKDEDFKKFLAGRVASGSATPDQVAWGLGYLGLDGVPDGLGQQPVHPGTNQAPTPSLEGHPSRGAPSANALESLALLTAASEPMVLRALERVGNRLRSRGHKPPDTPAHEVYLFAECKGSTDDLLSEAWAMVPTVCEGLADPTKVTLALNSYTEMLLNTQSKHSRQTLTKYLVNL